MKRLWFLALSVVLLTTPAFQAASAATSPVLAQAAASSGGTVSGTVLDARHAPLGGATIDISGAGTHATATSAADGTFSITLSPGIYDLIVRKGGFQQIEDANISVLAGETTPFRVTLGEATISNVRVIGSVSTASSASSSITPLATLSGVQLVDRQVPSLQEILPEVPGVTFGTRGDSTDSYQYFTVRGAAIETRLELDGHPINPGYGGRWDVSQLNPDVFGAIDVFKGAGIDGADAGESVFGTINLRTRDFTRNNTVEARIGVDQYGAEFSSFNATGNLLDDRLSYVLGYNVNGVVGPEHNQYGWDVYPDPANPGKGLAVFNESLADDVNQHSELAKLRYRFSDATSFTAAFVGFQGTQNPQGPPYGDYVGPTTIEHSAIGSDGATLTYSAPNAGGVVGQTIPGYVWYPGTFTTTNQPFFEGELRTTVGSDTLLLRPYTGIVTRIVNGNDEADYPDAQFNLGWTKDASGNYVENYGSPYDEIESNRLHGVTFTYLHPFGRDNTLDFSYDYHSAFTSDYYGYPDLTNVGAAPTTARTNDISLSSQFTVAPNVKLAVGDYQTIWNLDYLYGLNADIPLTRTASHNDPHLGLNWRPSPNFALRASGGSGITVPYASQVSGFESVSNGNSGIYTLETVNPSLNPEVTVAYGLGADLVLPDRAKLSLDLYDNTIHGAFVQSIYGVAPTVNPTLSPNAYTQVSQYINGPIERNYGIELALASGSPIGFGYDLSVTLQRAYYDQLSPSFYALTASNAINGAQISGIPFTSAHGELNWTSDDRKTKGGFGADYAGVNNWTNGPGLTTYYAYLRQNIAHFAALQISVANLFNAGTGAPYGFAVYNGGFSQAQLGPNASGTGLAYSGIPQFLQSIPPLTIRFALSKHIDW